jgi:Flp pilus assembly protein TadD
MKILVTLLLLTLAVQAAAVTLSDCAGVVRVYGDASSWMTSCFVVGDGSWVVTTADAVTEKITSAASQTVRTAIFISAYTGDAVQCEIKAKNADLNVALLRLPASGLPAVPFAKPSDLAKASYGTLGQLMSGDQMGSYWPTDIIGVTREKSGDTYKLKVGKWTADKAFVTDIGEYKWMFLSAMSERNMPAGSIVARGEIVAAMYLNRLVLTGGGTETVYGRCAYGPEIAKFLAANGVNTAILYSPPSPSVKADESAARVFQLNASIYTQIGAGVPAAALSSAAELSKLRPTDAQAQAAYGIALTSAGKFDEAIKAFDQAAKLDSSLPALVLDRALALVGLKKRPEAEAELTKAVQAAPSDVRALTAIADFYLADDKTADKALTYATKVVQLAPNSPAALLLQARAQKRLKQYDTAIKTIESAIKLAPDWPPAQYALGATYEESGDKTNAEKAYRRLADLQPKSPDALLTLAGFLADNGKTTEALDVLAKVRALNPPKAALDAAQAIQDKINPPTK